MSYLFFLTSQVLRGVKETEQLDIKVYISLKLRFIRAKLLLSCY